MAESSFQKIPLKRFL